MIQCLDIRIVFVLAAKNEKGYRILNCELQGCILFVLWR